MNIVHVLSSFTLYKVLLWTQTFLILEYIPQHYVRLYYYEWRCRYGVKSYINNTFLGMATFQELPRARWIARSFQRAIRRPVGARHNDAEKSSAHYGCSMASTHNKRHFLSIDKTNETLKLNPIDKYFHWYYFGLSHKVPLWTLTPSPLSLIWKKIKKGRGVSLSCLCFLLLV